MLVKNATGSVNIKETVIQTVRTHFQDGETFNNTWISDILINYGLTQKQVHSALTRWSNVFTTEGHRKAVSPQGQRQTVFSHRRFWSTTDTKGWYKVEKQYTTYTYNHTDQPTKKRWL